jgi:hypothetical protein
MIPRVRPAPLSACTLVGLSDAKPQPAAINCSAAGGSAGGAFVAGRGVKVGPRLHGTRPWLASGSGPAASGSAPPPSMIITGAAARESAGSTSVMQISTEIAGYAELSTVPTSWRPTTLRPPLVHSRVAIVAHETRGTSAGIRPTTSRSKSATISGRRWPHHASAVVTFAPFFSVSGSGSRGYGFASASS